MTSREKRAPSRPVGPLDAVWLQMDRSTNLMVVTSVIFLKSQPDWEDVLRLVQERVVARYPVFRQRPVPAGTPFGGLRWADDEEFELTRHVSRASLTPPGDDAALQAYIGELAARPFDWTHPLWEMHLVEGYGSGAALVCRSHHALADGLALARVLLSMTDDEHGLPTDEATAADDGPDAGADHDHGWVPSLLSSGIDLAALLGRVGYRGLRTVTDPAGLVTVADLAWRTGQVAYTLLFTTNRPSPVTGEPGSRKLVVWSQPRPIAGLKELGRVAGATLNDVLMSAAAASLHTYQAEHGREPVDLTTMVPVNLRPPDKPLPRTLGNQFALVMLTLPSALAPPLARLAETKRRMDWIKDSPEPVLTYGIMDVIGRLNRDLGRHLVDFFANKTIGVTTNVRGPDTVRYLAGTAVTGVLGWVPGSGRQTLGICIFTYAGTVQVGFMSDQSVIPDPERLLAAFEDELTRLVELGRSETRARRPHAHRQRTS